MVRRGRNPGAGRWSIPGGRVEPGEAPEHAAARELAEETGIQAECEALMGAIERRGPDHHFVILDYRMTLVGNGDPVTGVPVTGVPVTGVPVTGVPVAGDPMAGDDAAEASWIPLAEVAQLDLVDGLAAFLAEHGVIAEA